MLFILRRDVLADIGRDLRHSAPVASIISWMRAARTNSFIRLNASRAVAPTVVTPWWRMISARLRPRAAMMRSRSSKLSVRPS